MRFLAPLIVSMELDLWFSFAEGTSFNYPPSHSLLHRYRETDDPKRLKMRLLNYFVVPMTCYLTVPFIHST